MHGFACLCANGMRVCPRRPTSKQSEPHTAWRQLTIRRNILMTERIMRKILSLIRSIWPASRSLPATMPLQKRTRTRSIDRSPQAISTARPCRRFGPRPDVVLRMAASWPLPSIITRIRHGLTYSGRFSTADMCLLQLIQFEVMKQKAKNPNLGHRKLNTM